MEHAKPQENQNSDFKSISKDALSLVWPVAGSRIISMLSSFIGMLMLAQLGKNDLAASNLILSWQTGITVIAMSILFSVSAMVSQAYGAKRYDEIGTLLQQGWLLGLLISLPTVLILHQTGNILLFLKQSPILVNIIDQFFNTYLYGVPALLLLTSTQQFFFAVGRQRLVIVANTFGLITLLITGYAFIYGHFGFPAMGAKGLGYAFSLQLWTSLLCLISFIVFQPCFKIYRIFDWRFHQDLSPLKKLFKIGWPISFQVGGELVLFMFISVMTGWLGVTALAASQVVRQFIFIMVVPMFSISQAHGILVAKSFGAKKLKDIAKLPIVCIGFGFMIILFFSILFLGFPKALASLYININNPENLKILNLIISLLIINIGAQCFDTIRNILTGGLRGMYDTRMPMYISFICLWLIGLPVGYFLAFHMGEGVIGLNIGSFVGIVVGSICIILRWQTQIKNIAAGKHHSGTVYL